MVQSYFNNETHSSIVQNFYFRLFIYQSISEIKVLHFFNTSNLHNVKQLKELLTFPPQTACLDSPATLREAPQTRS